MTPRENRRKSVSSQEGFIPAQSQYSGRSRSHNAAFSPVSYDDAQSRSTRAPRHSRTTVQPVNSRINPSINPSTRSTRAQSSRGSYGQMGYSSAGANNAYQYSRYSTDYSDRAAGMSRGKKIGITALIIVLVAAVVGLGVFVYKEYQKDLLNNDLHGGMSRSELLAIDAELTGMTTFDEPFTVLLLGSDARSDDPTMGARTDTIVLVRIDPTTNNITMLSIPRDTRINIDGVGYEKFNAAYTYGGAKGAISAVKELCGIEIDHYAEVNFEGLVGLIDAIGGIDVVVDEEINDPNAGSIVIPAGEQHLDGEAALVFSRSRAYADGDYTRVSNQRKVIEAIIQRGLEAPANELYGLVRQSASFLKTDSAMDIDFIFSLADQMRHNNDYPITITTATIPSTPQMIGDVSYVIADTQGIKDIIKIFLKSGDVAAFMEDYEAPFVDNSVYGYSSGYGSSGSSSGYDYSSGYNSGYDNGYSTGYDSTGYGSGYGSGTGYETGTNTTDTSTGYGTGTESASFGAGY